MVCATQESSGTASVGDWRKAWPSLGCQKAFPEVLRDGWLGDESFKKVHRQRSGQKGDVCKGPGAGGVAVYSGNQKKNNQGSLSRV